MDLTRINIIYNFLFNLLVAIYNLLANNLGLAIVVVALIFKFVTLPIILRQIKSAKKNKEIQKKLDEVKNQYKNDPTRQAQEMAKYQGKLISGTLAGCLPLILTLVILLTMRSVILDLVDRGWHSFNTVSYSEEWKKPVDALVYKNEVELPVGKNEIELNVTSSNEIKATRKYTIFVYTNETEKADYEKQWEEIKKVELEQLNSSNNDISFYSPQIDINVKEKNVISDRKPTWEFYFRAPSKEVINQSKTIFLLNLIDKTKEAKLTEGVMMNLDFLGINVSKVATSFPLTDPVAWPYIVLALLLGATQVVSSTLSMNQMNGVPTTPSEKELVVKKKNEEKGKKDEKDPTANMEKMMGSMNKQMSWVFGGITVITALGFWGGAQFFPAGLSIFWTVQNLFGIIQNAIQKKITARDLEKELKPEEKKGKKNGKSTN